MKMFKRAAAVFSAAAMAVTGLAALAMNASADDEIIIAADEVTITEEQAQAGEWIAFDLMIENNPGYAAAGISLLYDPATVTARPEDENTPTLAYYEEGPAAARLSPYVNLNSDEGIVGYATMGTRVNNTSGTIITVYFKVPTDAKGGDVFPINVSVDQLADAQSNKMETVTKNGFIQVEEKTTTTTTTTTTTESTTTTTTTTESTTTTTTTSGDETETTTTTTSTGDETDTTTSTTASESSASSSSSTTAAPSVPANKTGDAGVGIAIAGLLAAAGAAVVLRKKED